MSLISKVIGITIGIRYQRSFRIPAISGEMIDNILHNNSSPFNSNIFDGVQEVSTGEKVLFKESTKEYLRINTDDLILGIKVQENFEDKFKWLKNNVVPYFGNQLFPKFKIKNISRLGIVFYHGLKEYNSFDDIVSKLTNKSIVNNVEDINISFSRKTASKEALIRKKVQDYTNTLFKIVEIRQNLLAELDYQYYFTPILEDFRDGYPDQILKNAKRYLTDDYHTWLIDYERKEK
jgi:hypothetical protein